MERKHLASCPRCGQLHDDLEVRTLADPIIDPQPADPERPCTYHEWAVCPTGGEPILFQQSRLNDILIPIKPHPDSVAALAYQIWEMDGRKDGFDRLHWGLAEASLTGYFRIPSALKFTQTFASAMEHDFLDRIRAQVAATFDKSVEANKWLDELMTRNGGE